MRILGRGREPVRGREDFGRLVVLFVLNIDFREGETEVEGMDWVSSKDVK